MELAKQFSAYSAWRSAVSDQISALRTWLKENELIDGHTDGRLQAVLNRLRDDKMAIAFVAEFSRGKSELINAIFFSEYGNRVLPSSAGRTTMCPTELLYDANWPDSIQLLPIETRAQETSVTDLKYKPECWRILPLDTTSATTMHQTLRRVGEVKRVTVEEAQRLGFTIDEQGGTGLKPDTDGTVEIPAWRHAIINFPHPLLKQGLVILDTPGLNAIGAEPELTLSLLPSAHAVLFILAADTGVTQSDMAVWRNHVSAAAAHQSGRVVVLNKIDGLWDGLRADEEIAEEVDKQSRSVAEMLGVDARQVFPLSAQKGLVAKINNDEPLLDRSRLLQLEHSLANELLPKKRHIVGNNVGAEAGDVIGRTGELLATRLEGLHEQQKELSELRGKNKSVIEYMMRKVTTEKADFERSLQRFYAVRSVFSSLTNKLFGHLGMDTLREETRRTRQRMLDAAFSIELSEAMDNYFGHLRKNLSQTNSDVTELSAMMESMYKRFSADLGLNLGMPMPFSAVSYEKELSRLEQSYRTHFNTLINLLTLEKRTLTQKFFETVAVQARKIFESANRDVENWLRNLMAPLESQIREHQLHLKRRLESVRRIHQATDTLEDRLKEIAGGEAALLAQINNLNGFRLGLERLLTTTADAALLQESPAVNSPTAPTEQGGAATGESHGAPTGELAA